MTVKVYYQDRVLSARRQLRCIIRTACCQPDDSYGVLSGLRAVSQMTVMVHSAEMNLGVVLWFSGTRFKRGTVPCRDVEVDGLTLSASHLARQCGPFHCLPTVWAVSLSADSVGRFAVCRQCGQFRCLPTVWLVSCPMPTLWSVFSPYADSVCKSPGQAMWSVSVSADSVVC